MPFVTLRLRSDKDDLVCEVTGYTVDELRASCDYVRSLLDFSTSEASRSEVGRNAAVYDVQTGACRPSLAASVVYYLLRGDRGAPIEVDGANAAELLSLADLWCLDHIKGHVVTSLRKCMCNGFRRPVAGTSAVEAVPQVAALAKQALEFGVGDADGSLQRLYDDCMTWLATWATRVWPTRTFAGMQRAIQDDVLTVAKGRVTAELAPAVLAACRQLSGIPSVAWAQRVAEMRAELTSHAMSFLWSNFTEVCAHAGSRRDRSECWGALLEELRAHVAENPDPDAAVRALPRWGLTTKALLYGKAASKRAPADWAAKAPAVEDGPSWLGDDEAAQMQELYEHVRSYCVRHMPLVMRSTAFRALPRTQQHLIVQIAQEGVGSPGRGAAPSPFSDVSGPWWQQPGHGAPPLVAAGDASRSSAAWVIPRFCPSGPSPASLSAPQAGSHTLATAASAPAQMNAAGTPRQMPAAPTRRAVAPAGAAAASASPREPSRRQGPLPSAAAHGKPGPSGTAGRTAGRTVSRAAAVGGSEAPAHEPLPQAGGRRKPTLDTSLPMRSRRQGSATKTAGGGGSGRSEGEASQHALARPSSASSAAVSEAPAALPTACAEWGAEAATDVTAEDPGADMDVAASALSDGGAPHVEVEKKGEEEGRLVDDHDSYEHGGLQSHGDGYEAEAGQRNFDGADGPFVPEAYSSSTQPEPAPELVGPDSNGEGGGPAKRESEEILPLQCDVHRRLAQTADDVQLSGLARQLSERGSQMSLRLRLESQMSLGPAISDSEVEAAGGATPRVCASPSIAVAVVAAAATAVGDADMLEDAAVVEAAATASATFVHVDVATGRPKDALAASEGAGKAGLAGDAGGFGKDEHYVVCSPSVSDTRTAIHSVVTSPPSGSEVSAGGKSSRVVSKADVSFEGTEADVPSGEEAIACKSERWRVQPSVGLQQRELTAPPADVSAGTVTPVAVVAAAVHSFALDGDTAGSVVSGEVAGIDAAASSCFSLPDMGCYDHHMMQDNVPYAHPDGLAIPDAAAHDTPADGPLSGGPKSEDQGMMAALAAASALTASEGQLMSEEDPGRLSSSSASGNPTQNPAATTAVTTAAAATAAITGAAVRNSKAAEAAARPSGAVRAGGRSRSAVSATGPRASAPKAAAAAAAPTPLTSAVIDHRVSSGTATRSTLRSTASGSSSAGITPVMSSSSTRSNGSQVGSARAAGVSRASSATGGGSTGAASRAPAPAASTGAGRVGTTTVVVSQRALAARARAAGSAGASTGSHAAAAQPGSAAAPAQPAEPRYARPTASHPARPSTSSSTVWGTPLAGDNSAHAKPAHAVQRPASAATPHVAPKASAAERLQEAGTVRPLAIMSPRAPGAAAALMGAGARLAAPRGASAAAVRSSTPSFIGPRLPRPPSASGAGAAEPLSRPLRPLPASGQTVPARAASTSAARTVAATRPSAPAPPPAASSAVFPRSAAERRVPASVRASVDGAVSGPRPRLQSTAEDMPLSSLAAGGLPAAAATPRAATLAAAVDTPSRSDGGRARCIPLPPLEYSPDPAFHESADATAGALEAQPSQLSETISRHSLTRTARSHLGSGIPSLSMEGSFSAATGAHAQGEGGPVTPVASPGSAQPSGLGMEAGSVTGVLNAGSSAAQVGWTVSTSGGKVVQYRGAPVQAAKTVKGGRGQGRESAVGAVWR